MAILVEASAWDNVSLVDLNVFVLDLPGHMKLLQLSQDLATELEIVCRARRPTLSYISSCSMAAEERADLLHSSPVWAAVHTRTVDDTKGENGPEELRRAERDHLARR